MEKTTEIWTGFRSLLKLYDNMLKEVCAEHGLTLTQAEVISFLRNNPGKDTAADIVELRMISKAAVSKAVEELIQRSLLERVPDTEDRRKIHLKLRPGGGPVTEGIDRAGRQFKKIIFAGFTEEERAVQDRLFQRLVENSAAAMERTGLTDGNGK